MKELFTADQTFGKAGMEKKDQEEGLKAIPRQLALPFTYRPRFIFSDFIGAASNAAARAWLGIHQEGWTKIDWPEQRLAIWGDVGSGKTHLLQIWAEKQAALFLPGTALDQNPSTYWPDYLHQEAIKALVIDDADTIIDSHALLHLLNLANEQSLTLVLSGRSPPSRWKVSLPDLTSRLRAIMTVKIEQPEDELLRILLLRLLAERQLVVDSSIVEWLLLRLPRTAAAVREAVDQLDQATLADGGKITRGIANQILSDLLFSTKVISEKIKRVYYSEQKSNL